MQKIVTIVSVSLALTLFSAAADAHPFTEYSVNEPRNTASGISADAEIGEVKFTFDFPEPSELSAAEKYMLAGASDGPDGGLQSWVQQVMLTAIAYQRKTKSWPAAISDEVIAATVDGDASRLRETLKSPITGRYPRLDSVSYSPGDLYMRLMTDEELAFVAAQSPVMARMRQTNLPGGRTRVLLGNPVYYRVYGEHQIITANFTQLYFMQ